ncbi:hypothetical protein B0O80DRAFT_255722 [Mortierella sp. GBAus27b]|nr:hypothetical protein B0O80DRAFT_255722 [Mortierella sp. GBAus27b]
MYSASIVLLLTHGFSFSFDHQCLHPLYQPLRRRLIRSYHWMVLLVRHGRHRQLLPSPCRCRTCVSPSMPILMLILNPCRLRNHWTLRMLDHHHHRRWPGFPTRTERRSLRNPAYIAIQHPEESRKVAERFEIVVNNTNDASCQPFGTRWSTSPTRLLPNQRPRPVIF